MAVSRYGTSLARVAVASFTLDEAGYYESFQGLPGFPMVYWTGQKDDFDIIVLELLGPSLEDLFTYCGHQLSLKTTVMLADQLVARLEAVHSKGLLHRDVKPSNFLLGMGEKGNTVYITDFGISMDYVANLTEESEQSLSTRPRVVGTTRFASVKAHAGRVQSPKDDLESLGYVLIYFLRGILPWQGLKAHNVEEKDRLVREKKETTSVEDLCSGLPPEFAEYMTTVKSLGLGSRPPYKRLRKLFRDVAGREGIDYDNVFDWTERLYLSQHRSGQRANRYRQEPFIHR
ncbi:casein kinase I [Friedmanniomyces endolithicus]|uniref:non-specific serine/threonine protein kinase n=1 Tax=Rachicladosporium monterosium TaxID=1507873 RepID=A0ABR0L9Q6_9PEZI|nr:casein kinase I [Friedmanniomyces endolithicus]KAK5145654.1 hypothetical protein LTR32_002627 [Rachicladosporium monterosium]